MQPRYEDLSVDKVLLGSSPWDTVVLTLANLATPGARSVPGELLTKAFLSLISETYRLQWLGHGENQNSVYFMLNKILQ